MSEPSVYKKGKYYWTHGYDADRKRYSVSTKQVGLREAKRVAKRIQQERSKTSRTEHLALIDVLRLVHNEAELNRRSVATLQIIAEKSNALQRVFGGNRDLNSIGLTDVQSYITQRRKHEGRPGQLVGDHTIKKEIKLLKRAFTVALRHGLWSGVPEQIVPSDLLRGSNKPRKRWLPMDEFERLIEELPEHRRDYVVMYCYTGMRYSELFKICPKDVDLEKQTLHVRGTKTKGADRRFRVNGEVLAILKRRMLKEPMFDMWYSGSICRDLKNACARAGIERVSPNDLRRTFASWLINNDVPEAKIAKLMGHTKSDMVRLVYGQLSDASLDEAIEKLPRRGKPMTEGKVVRLKR